MSTQQRAEAVETVAIECTVNGRVVSHVVPARKLLVDFLRIDLGLTGTHIGCEQGICGACTIIMDGAAVRSCITLAVQANGCMIRTVEDLAHEGQLNELQTAFKMKHALQCGFCTPGFLMTVTAAEPTEYPEDDDIRELISGNLCRCTGYQKIVEAIRQSWGRA